MSMLLCYGVLWYINEFLETFFKSSNGSFLVSVYTDASEQQIVQGLYFEVFTVKIVLLIFSVNCLLSKLDGVGLVDNRPSTDLLHQLTHPLCPKQTKKNNNGDM